ncbi:MAG: branched-chain amino acid ABC transporter permease [Candidatus Rokubacteria bacterium]|nr:branched-chain amino acid ABC transporter permease [Candidatus Rokubacteria bacterium]
MDLVESYREDLRLVRKWPARVLVTLLLGGLLVLPRAGSDYLVYIVTLIAVYTIGILGQNLLIGYTGQISFGQAGFLAIGAFTLAHLVRNGVPFAPSLFVAGLNAGLFGVLVGFPALRLKGPYLAVATLGFGVAVYQGFANWDVLSGGRMGLTLPPLAWWGVRKMVLLYYLNVGLAVLFTLATYNLVSSYVGRALIAIRDSDIAAEMMGVSLTRYKLLAFGLSSFYTGVQGGLLAQLFGYLEPQMFTVLETVTMFVGVVVGGLGLVEGSIFGAAFAILVPQVFAGYRELVPTVFGVAILLVMMLEPHGLAGRWLKLRLYVSNWPFR